MRPLGLLGAALSGAPPFAELGTGTPNATKFLRGDGVWATLPVTSAYEFVQAVPIAGIQFDVINLAPGYDYEFHFDDLISSGVDNLVASFGTNNTTFPTSSIYYNQYIGGHSDPGVSVPWWGWGSNSGFFAAYIAGLNNDPAVSAWTHFFVNDVGASKYKHYGAKGFFVSGSNGYAYGMNMEGYWRNASAITAIRFFSFQSYALTGTCLVYRRRRS